MIVYSKFNTRRLKKFQLITTIERRDQNLVVNKISDSEESMPFLQSLFDKYELIKKSNYPLQIIQPYRSDKNMLSFEFVTSLSLDHLLLKALKNKNKEDFLSLIERYASLIRSIPQKKHLPGKDFEEIFGDSIKQEISCCSVGCLDINFDNIFLEGEQVRLIDYEWTFNFPIPTDYIIFRALTAFYGNYINYRPNSLYSLAQLLEYFGISSQAQNTFINLEKCFQDYVYGKSKNDGDSLYIVKKKYDRLHADTAPLNYTQKLLALNAYALLLEKETTKKNDWILNLEEAIKSKDGWINKLEKDNAELTTSTVELSKYISTLQWFRDLKRNDAVVDWNELQHMKEYMTVLEHNSEKKNEWILKLEKMVEEKTAWIKKLESDLQEASTFLREVSNQIKIIRPAGNE